MKLAVLMLVPISRSLLLHAEPLKLGVPGRPSGALAAKYSYSILPPNERPCTTLISAAGKTAQGGLDDADCINCRQFYRRSRQ